MKTLIWRGFLLVVLMAVFVARPNQASLAQEALLRVFLVPTGTAGDWQQDDLIVAGQVIERRLAGLGYNEARVLVLSDGILVKVRGVFENEALIDTLVSPSLLEFVDFSGLGEEAPLVGDCILTSAQLANFGDGLSCGPLEVGGERRPATSRPNGEGYVTVVTGQGLDKAKALHDGLGEWSIRFWLNDEAASIFSDFTASHIGQPLAIVLDGDVLSVPIIQGRIGGEGSIIGNFSREEAENLAVQLRSGVLPVTLKVASIELITGTA